MKHILIISYSQTGQLDTICNSVFSLVEGECVVEHCRIVPKNAFPFPWDSPSFFNAMPDSVMGISHPYELDKLPHRDYYDVIVLAYSVWFLHPCIPFRSFLNSEFATTFLKNKKIITILGVRNMWYNAQEIVKKKLQTIGALLIGNIVLIDRHPNLISVITIVHWLMRGKKDRYLSVFPRPGVSEKDIQQISSLGPIIIQNVEKANLQSKLVENGAVNAIPVLFFIDKTATRIFKLWAAIIVKKGNSPEKKKFWVNLYKYYLYFVIFTIMPLVSGIHFIISPFFTSKILKKKAYFEGVSYLE